METSKALKILSIQKGSVFRMELKPTDGVTPKHLGEKSRDKYFIIVGIDKGKITVCSTLINTEINKKLFNIIAPYQHQINASEYEFLNGRDRYINCFRLIELDYNRIIEEAEYIGIIKPELLQELLSLLRKSPQIKPEQLKRFQL